jgi:hypothetical protein
MKKAILFLLLIGVAIINAQSQSLKDLLYSGKLKKDSNTVIRKGEDLASRIDTSTKKPAEPEKSPSATVSVSDQAKNITATSDVATSTDAKDATAGTVNTTNTNASLVKNNNQLLKHYMDSLVSTLKTDVLPSKKIKNGTYYLYVDYEIGTDGQANVTNVVSSPENDFLQSQIKERLTLSAPQLNPVLDSNNKPRKVKRKYNFNVTKN